MQDKTGCAKSDGDNTSPRKLNTQQATCTSTKHRSFLSVFLWWVCFAIACSVFLFAMCKIVSEVTVRNKDDTLYQNMAQDLANATVQEHPTQGANSATTTGGDNAHATPLDPTARAQAEQAARFAQYRAFAEENSDFVGWISIEDTILNYPVMQTIDNPEYYLHKDFYKEYSYSGTPFLDARCSLSPQSQNLLIYAHNMNNDTMFGTLSDYRKQDYWEAHPTITFDTLDTHHTYQVVYAFAFDIASTDAFFAEDSVIDFAREADYNDFIATCNTHACYDTGVSITQDDTFLTLITCSSLGEDGRFVVIAKQMETP